MLLPPAPAAEVYAVDHRSAELCRAMQRNGFAYDAGRAAVLSAHLRGLEAAAILKASEAVGRRIGLGKGGGFSTTDLRAAFFSDLRAPIFFRSEITGNPSLGVDTLRAYACSADERLQGLALAVLEQRRARKVRSTHIDRIKIGSDRRVHPTWQNFGAVSGRFSCASPNLMNLPRPENDPTMPLGGVRGLYVAPPGRRLVAFDAKQLEMRMAAYASGDEIMIAACESSDLHSANAAIIFGEDFEAAQGPARKALRSLAKQSGFATCYMADASTVYARIVAAGVSVTLRQVEAMLARMRRAFAAYYRWQTAVLDDCVRTGYVCSPIVGRRRWLGHDPSPPECANFPIQSGAADLMNLRLPEIYELLAAEYPTARLVAQVHDSGVIECEVRHVEAVSQLCSEIFTRPIEVRSSGRTLTASFPIDLEVSERWH